MSRTSHAKHEHKKSNNQHQAHSRQAENTNEPSKFGTEVMVGIMIFALGMFFMVPVYSALTVGYQFALLIVFMCSVAAFVFFHWRKLKRTELNHQKLPILERFVFLSIITMLSVAIIIQALNRDLDVWLVVILVLAILIKIFAEARLNK